jgi:hypothetical protein
MPLFHVQDSDRPIYVVAADFNAAVGCWRQLLAVENPDDVAECHVANPCGVTLVAEDGEFLDRMSEKVERLTEALQAIQTRIASIGMPSERKVDGKPDWSEELKLVEAALALK